MRFLFKKIYKILFFMLISCSLVEEKEELPSETYSEMSHERISIELNTEVYFSEIPKYGFLDKTLKDLRLKATLFDMVENEEDTTITHQYLFVYQILPYDNEDFVYIRYSLIDVKTGKYINEGTLERISQMFVKIGKEQTTAIIALSELFPDLPEQHMFLFLKLFDDDTVKSALTTDVLAPIDIVLENLEWPTSIPPIQDTLKKASITDFSPLAKELFTSSYNGNIGKTSTVQFIFRNDKYYINHISKTPFLLQQNIEVSFYKYNIVRNAVVMKLETPIEGNQYLILYKLEKDPLHPNVIQARLILANTYSIAPPVFLISSPHIFEKNDFLEMNNIELNMIHDTPPLDSIANFFLNGTYSTGKIFNINGTQNTLLYKISRQNSTIEYTLLDPKGNILDHQSKIVRFYSDSTYSYLGVYLGFADPAPTYPIILFTKQHHEDHEYEYIAGVFSDFNNINLYNTYLSFVESGQNSLEADQFTVLTETQVLADTFIMDFLKQEYHKGITKNKDKEKVFYKFRIFCDDSSGQIVYRFFVDYSIIKADTGRILVESSSEVNFYKSTANSEVVVAKLSKITTPKMQNYFFIASTQRRGKETMAISLEDNLNFSIEQKVNNIHIGEWQDNPFVVTEQAQHGPVDKTHPLVQYLLRDYHSVTYKDHKIIFKLKLIDNDQNVQIIYDIFDIQSQAYQKINHSSLVTLESITSQFKDDSLLITLVTPEQYIYSIAIVNQYNPKALVPENRSVSYGYIEQYMPSLRKVEQNTERLLTVDKTHPLVQNILSLKEEILYFTMNNQEIRFKLIERNGGVQFLYTAIVDGMYNFMDEKSLVNLYTFSEKNDASQAEAIVLELKESSKMFPKGTIIVIAEEKSGISVYENISDFMINHRFNYSYLLKVASKNLFYPISCLSISRLDSTYRLGYSMMHHSSDQSGSFNINQSLVLEYTLEYDNTKHIGRLHYSLFKKNVLIHSETVEFDKFVFNTYNHNDNFVIPLDKKIHNTIYNTLLFYRDDDHVLKAGLYMRDSMNPIKDMPNIQKASTIFVTKTANIYPENVSSSFDLLRSKGLIKIEHPQSSPGSYRQELFINFSQATRNNMHITLTFPDHSDQYFSTERKPVDIILHPKNKNIFAIDLGKEYSRELPRYLVFFKKDNHDFKATLSDSATINEWDSLIEAMEVMKASGLPQVQTPSDFYNNAATSGKIYEINYDLPINTLSLFDEFRSAHSIAKFQYTTYHGQSLMMYLDLSYSTNLPIFIDSINQSSGTIETVKYLKSTFNVIYNSSVSDTSFFIDLGLEVTNQTPNVPRYIYIEKIRNGFKAAMTPYIYWDRNLTTSEVISINTEPSIVSISRLTFKNVLTKGRFIHHREDQYFKIDVEDLQQDFNFIRNTLNNNLFASQLNDNHVILWKLTKRYKYESIDFSILNESTGKYLLENNKKSIDLYYNPNQSQNFFIVDTQTRNMYVPRYIFMQENQDQSDVEIAYSDDIDTDIFRLDFTPIYNTSYKITNIRQIDDRAVPIFTFANNFVNSHKKYAILDDRYKKFFEINIKPNYKLDISVTDEMTGKVIYESNDYEFKENMYIADNTVLRNKTFVLKLPYMPSDKLGQSLPQYLYLYNDAILFGQLLPDTTYNPALLTEHIITIDPNMASEFILRVSAHTIQDSPSLWNIWTKKQRNNIGYFDQNGNLISKDSRYQLKLDTVLTKNQALYRKEEDGVEYNVLITISGDDKKIEIQEGTDKDEFILIDPFVSQIAGMYAYRVCDSAIPIIKPVYYPLNSFRQNGDLIDTPVSQQIRYVKTISQDQALYSFIYDHVNGSTMDVFLTIQEDDTIGSIGKRIYVRRENGYEETWILTDSKYAPDKGFIIRVSGLYAFKFEGSSYRKIGLFTAHGDIVSTTDSDLKIKYVKTISQDRAQYLYNNKINMTFTIEGNKIHIKRDDGHKETWILSPSDHIEAKFSWKNVGNSGISRGRTLYTSLIIGADDLPIVAYEDFGYQAKATVQRFNKAQWNIVGSSALSTGEVAYTKLIKDHNDSLYIVYQDGGPVRGRATVKKFNGQWWMDVGPPRFTDISEYTTIAIDNQNVPYVAFQDGVNGKATVKKFDGKWWVDVGTPKFSAGEAFDISLIISPNNDIYIAYQDGGSQGKAKVKKFNGRWWEDYGAEYISEKEAQYTSLALDNEGTLYLAYMDQAKGNRATVKKFNGQNWITVGTPGFSLSTAEYISLAIDSNNNIYIAYQDGYRGSVTVKKFNGQWWMDVGSPRFSAGEASNISLAVNSQGVVYIAYKDVAVGSKVTVQQYTLD